MGQTFDYTEFDAVETIKYRDFDNSVQELHPKQALAFSSEQIPFETQAITYFTVAQLMEQANLTLENSKLELRRLNGKLYNSYVNNEELKARNNNRKPTDAMITAAINATNDYVVLNKQVNELQTKYNILKDLFKAFEQRKDLMQSIAAQKRAELHIGSNTTVSNN